MAGNLAHNRLDLVRQSAAIGIAQHHPARARRMRRLGTGHRIGRIGLEPVKKVLAIQHRLFAMGDDGRDGIADALDVLFQRNAQRDMDVIIPRLGDQTDAVGGIVEQRVETGIVGNRTPCPLGHAESDKTGFFGRLLQEKFAVERIGTGIAAFDIIHAQPVQQSGNLPLVLEREIDPRGLRPVAQGRVEQIEPVRGSGCGKGHGQTCQCNGPFGAEASGTGWLVERKR